MKISFPHDKSRLMAVFTVLSSTLLLAFPGYARIPHCRDIQKSVVKITVTGRVVALDAKGVFFKETEVLGSGVLLDSHRHVLTAAHVVGFARAIHVSNPSGDTVDAHPIMLDREVDVAVLELERDLPGTQPVRLARHAPQPGDELWALGHPLNMEYSLSRGIVSAIRDLSQFGMAGWNGHVIQTDAAMNPGVSGGGLFNEDGRLVGIAVSILSTTGGSEGIGFGIDLEAIEDVLAASPCIWLGMDAVTLPKEVGQVLGLPEEGAYLVQQLFPGGAAARAGLRGGQYPAAIGDATLVLGGSIITRIDGYEECRKACRHLAGNRDATAEVALDVWQQGTIKTLKIPMEGKHVDWSAIFDGHEKNPSRHEEGHGH